MLWKAKSVNWGGVWQAMQFPTRPEGAGEPGSERKIWRPSSCFLENWNCWTWIVKAPSAFVTQSGVARFWIDPRRRRA